MYKLFSTQDARRCSCDIYRRGSEFAKENTQQVFLALSVYSAVMDDLEVPEPFQYAIKHLICTTGLDQYVATCGELADQLLEGMATIALPGSREAMQWELHATDLGTLPICRVLDIIDTKAADYADAVRRSLQFLLFFERFTYIGDDDADASALMKFKTVNKRCREYNSHTTAWPGQALCSLVRQELGVMFTARNWSYRIEDCHFSSGTTTDMDGRSLVGKLRALRLNIPHLYGEPMYPLVQGRYGYRREVAYPRLLTVPKNLTSRRVIAPEDTVLSYYAQAALEALRRMLGANGTMSFINEKDQSVNRSIAESGSLTGYWATIDMSSASDSISRSLFFYCLPDAFKDMYLEYMAHKVRVPRGKGYEVVTLDMLLTSGNPLTWLTEACWFLALGRVGVRLAASGTRDARKYRTLVFSFGDDLEVPAYAYETVCEVLEAFGHTVNRRKSYGAGVFRESCGGWYCQGTNVTPTFWPRRPVSNGVADSVSCLCSLQHNLYAAGLSLAADECARLAKGLYPRLTSSEPGSSNQDLWDERMDEYTSHRYEHTKFVVEYSAKLPLDPVSQELYEMYVYTQYLLWGPLYESRMDEMLGISTQRYRPARDSGKPVMVIR